MNLRGFPFFDSCSFLFLFVTLEEGAKLTDEDNGVGRWIKKQLNNLASPFFNWNKGEIRDAIDRLKRTASLILIGENSVGKTSFAMILAFAFSRWHIWCQKLSCLAAVRVTQDIDFLKSTTGCPEEPVWYQSWAHAAGDDAH